jgi:hypothetical protein
VTPRTAFQHLAGKTGVHIIVRHGNREPNGIGVNHFLIIVSQWVAIGMGMAGLLGTNPTWTSAPSPHFVALFGTDTFLARSNT